MEMEANEEAFKNDIQLDELPYDIQLAILLKLNFKDILALSQTNRNLNCLASDETLWKYKLLEDMHKWRMVDSKTWPTHVALVKPSSGKRTTLCGSGDHVLHEHETTSYKRIYFEICPEIATNKTILNKIKSFQQLQSLSNATSTSECLSSYSNNLTLSSLSSFAMPMMVLGQLKNFVYRNIFTSPDQFTGSSTVPDNESGSISKLILFGPGLETTTSCLVTNLLWKSEFKTIGMIPGKDGYGAGIKLKLFNHKPFNLTILYTNISKERTSNTEHSLASNRLLLDTRGDTKAYEVQPRVKEACSNAHGFVYVIDSDHLSSLNGAESGEELIQLNENYKTELNVLMNEIGPDVPLLVLSLKTSSLKDMSEPRDARSLSCVDIIHVLELNKLKQNWQVRSCQIFQPHMKDITLGFEWMLNELDVKKINV